MPGSSTSWWSRVSDEDVLPLGRSIRALCNIIRNLYMRGLLAEELRPRKQDVAASEPDRRLDKVASIPPDESRQYQPLPDEFTGECGRRVLWMVQELGPPLLDCFEACINVQLPAPNPSARYKRVTPGSRTCGSERALRSKLLGDVVRAWTWRRPDGEEIRAIPFDLNLRTRVGFGRSEGPMVEEFSWPPRTWGDVVQLVGLLQACHAWMLFLGSGPRVSTVLSYNTDCLISSPNGWRLLGVEYKQPGLFGAGRQRDWPLAPVLVAAVKQQIRLARLVKDRGLIESGRRFKTNNLWVQMTDKSAVKGMGGDFTHMNSAFATMVKVFGLKSLLGPGNARLHTHRFRKTLARIVALALTTGQTILMDCFGHDDPDMTLGYMLSDRAIVSDAMRVQRELVILLAKDAIDASEGLGGSAGEVVRKAKREFLRVKGRSKLSLEDAYELADQLTLGGREWVYVMEGVICTLSQFDAGPCGAKKKLRRDPMNCQAGCSHQLIQAHYKNRTDDMVAYLLTQLERAMADKAEMLIASLAGQLRNHLYRWRDVYEKWISHPLVKTFGDIESAPFSSQGQRSDS